MSGKNRDDWREKMKSKPFRYWIRDEIEQIVKEKNIDRSRFSEYSKFAYDEIIRRFYYSFIDYEKHPRVDLSNCWLHFREKDVTVLGRIGARERQWPEFLHDLHALVPEPGNKKLYLILSQGWVYHGYADEMLTVLNGTDGLLEDFYIVPQSFDWVISYCDDGESAVLLQRNSTIQKA